MQTDKTIMSQHIEMAMGLSYCTKREEVEDILFNHWDLVNEDLVFEIRILSADLESFNQNHRSELLSTLEEWLENYLEKENIPSQNSIWEFLINLLKILTSANSDNQSIIHTEMQNNINLIDWPLSAAMRRYVQLYSIQQPEYFERIPDLIINLSRNIHAFPFGKQQEVESIALAGYEIVKELTRNNPQSYARALSNIGSTFLSLAESGVDAENNFHQALSVFEEAAVIFKSDNLVKNLFYVLYHKGVVLLSLGKLDVNPVSNLQQALTTFHEVIMICRSTEILGHKVPDTLYVTGSTYQNLAELGVDSETCFKQALGLFDEAIVSYRVNGSSKKLLDTLIKSGDVYMSLAKLEIEPVTNLRKSLIAFDGAAILCKADGLMKYLAIALYKKGRIYEKISELDINSEDNLRQAAVAFNEASGLYKELGLTEYLFHATYRKGVVFTSLAKLNIEPGNSLQQATAALDEASVICRDVSLSQELSTMLFMIGTAYQNLSELDISPVISLKKALIAFDEVVLIYRLTGSTQDIAGILTKSCTIYNSLADLDVEPSFNLQKALIAFDEVILIYRNDNLDEKLARTLAEFGIVYISLAILGVDPETNSRRAIIALDEAELIFKALGLAISIPRALEYKGVAYNILSQQDVNPVDNLQRAISIFEEVLIVCRDNNLKEELYSTLANYGVAYFSLSKLGIEPEVNSQKALDAFDEVIVFHRLEGSIKDLPIALNNSGIIYRNLAALGINSETNLNYALRFLEEVAMICKTEGLAKDLAYNFANLGNVYNSLAQLGISPEVNQDRAIESYRKALIFFNPDTTPAECLNTGSNLGNLGFTLKRWELAIEGYIPAIISIEQSRAWSKDEDHREEVQSKAIKVYTNIVQALIQLHRYPEALQYAERSRSKRLSDLMRVNDFYQKGEIPTVIKAKLDAYDALQRQIDAIYHKLDGNSSTLTLDTLRPSISEIEQQRVTALEAEQTTLWQELRRLDPIAAAGKRIIPLEIAEIGQLLGNDNHAALLSFFFTPTDTFIFIARRDSQQQLQIAVHHCPDQGTRTLHDAILEQWIKPYYADNNYREWSKQITPFLQECSDQLAINTLIAQHLDDTITDLILIPHLYLHQIPFAALPINTKDRAEFLGDRFTIRYAPSCEILKICDDRHDLNVPPNYGIIEGASLDVPYAAFQGEVIANLLNIPITQRLRGTTEATISNFKQLAQTVNILHSYHHASSDPNEPLKSSLALADGNITLAQILVWQLTGLQEVFLSCCETAFGLSQTITDEVFTLASGFLCAGASTVIATLWSVEQLSAALLCIFYYEQRELGLDRPHALQAAQHQLRQLSGATLEDVYGDQLEACLEMHRQQLYGAHELEQTKGEEAAQASFDRLNKVEEIINNLPQLYAQEHPFTAPVYWAAFTCQGLP